MVAQKRFINIDDACHSNFSELSNFKCDKKMVWVGHEIMEQNITMVPINPCDKALSRASDN
jgi:hypothetical protein